MTKAKIIEFLNRQTNMIYDLSKAQEQEGLDAVQVGQLYMLEYARSLVEEFDINKELAFMQEQMVAEQQAAEAREHTTLAEEAKEVSVPKQESKQEPKKKENKNSKAPTTATADSGEW